MGRGNRNATAPGDGKSCAHYHTRMRIEEYFRQIDAMLALFPQVALKTMSYDQRSDTKGFIRGVLLFDDESELHVREFMDVSAGIERFKYSYHYVMTLREGQPIYAE